MQAGAAAGCHRRAVDPPAHTMQHRSGLYASDCYASYMSAWVDSRRGSGWCKHAVKKYIACRAQHSRCGKIIQGFVQELPAITHQSQLWSTLDLCTHRPPTYRLMGNQDTEEISVFPVGQRICGCGWPVAEPVLSIDPLLGATTSGRISHIDAQGISHIDAQGDCACALHCHPTCCCSWWWGSVSELERACRLCWWPLRTIWACPM